MGDPIDKPASKLTQLGAACVAGFMASFLSLPFDLLKSRMRKCIILCVLSYWVVYSVIKCIYAADALYYVYSV